MHRLTPYVPGEQPKLSHPVKLNTNENPYGPSPKVLDAIRAELSDALRLYPDPNAERLKQAIAAYHAVAPSRVFVGNGSDEVLALLSRPCFTIRRRCCSRISPTAFIQSTVGCTASISSPCRWPGLHVASRRLRAAERRHHLRQSECAHRASVAAGRHRVAAGAQPRFGGGGGRSLHRLRRRHRHRPGGSLPESIGGADLIKARSLAGLRVGLAVGHAGLIEALERVKNSFNSYPLDRLAIAGAVAAFEGSRTLRAHRRAVIASRLELVAALERLGFEVLPSAANFVFARHPALMPPRWPPPCASAM